MSKSRVCSLFQTDNLMDIALNGSDDFGFTPEKYSEEAYNYLKQHMSMYQNLIPGESDEIFIPPSTTSKQHSGPRALHVDMQVRIVISVLC